MLNFLIAVMPEVFVIGVINVLMSILGHPQQWRENRDLAILQRYLERAVHEIDTRFKPHQKTERTGEGN